jgi:hypothetical protein
MPNEFQPPMVMIEEGFPEASNRPFDVSTISWMSQVKPYESPKLSLWQTIKFAITFRTPDDPNWRPPDCNWEIRFHESQSGKTPTPIYINQADKDWLDIKIQQHNLICDLVNHRTNMQSIYTGGGQQS